MTQKTDIKPLFFGLDYIAINCFKEKDKELYNNSLFVALLFLFETQSYNFTNANVYRDYNFLNLGEFNIQYSEMKAGTAIHFSRDGENLFLITRLSNEYAQGNISDYMYRIDFYGTFFNFTRLGFFDFKRMLLELNKSLFCEGITSSLTRIDICADIANVGTNEIVDGFTSSYDIKFSRLAENSEGAETIYIGNRSSNSKKIIRVYNKLIDSTKKKKKSFYLDYYQYEKVTRIELELHSELIKLYSITLIDILENSILLKIYCDVLANKWSRFDFIKPMKEFFISMGYPDLGFAIKKSGYENLMEDCDYVKRFMKMAERVEQIYRINPVVLLLQKKDMSYDRHALSRLKVQADKHFNS